MRGLSAMLLAIAPLLLAWPVPRLSADPGQAQAALQPRAEDVESQLVALKAQAMSADYRGDLADLARLRDQAARLTKDPELGYLAHYWAGFASWRLAINGASANMSPADLKAHLEQAAASFEAAVRLREDFADAHAAGSMSHGWLVRFCAGDPAAARQHLESARRLGKRAQSLAPANPRVLWMVGAELLYMPASQGGSPEQAIEVYRRMAALSEGRAAPRSPLPDWGKPEALMSLAYAHLNLATPDLAAADAEAREALRLVPDWHYVRDILLPMIEARRKSSGAKGGLTP